MANELTNLRTTFDPASHEGDVSVLAFFKGNTFIDRLASEAADMVYAIMQREEAYLADIKAGTAELLKLREENKRLREALRVMIYESTHLSPMEDDGSHWCKISREALEQARAAYHNRNE